MKFIITFIFAIVFSVTAHAETLDEITVTTKGKNASILVHFKSKKNTVATFTVTNSNGTIVHSETADLNKGKNEISIDEANNFPEGVYTVKMISKNKTSTATFIIWK